MKIAVWNAPVPRGEITVHPGISGKGDLNVSQWDWRNPVAAITVIHVE